MDKNNDNINYSAEQLNLDFSFFHYSFINDTNILFYCGYSSSDKLNKFVIYDLENRNIICTIKGKEYDNTLINVLPKIKTISKSVKIKYTQNQIYLMVIVKFIYWKLKIVNVNISLEKIIKVIYTNLKYSNMMYKISWKLNK